jgi:hypothetical protein
MKEIENESLFQFWEKIKKNMEGKLKESKKEK